MRAAVLVSLLVSFVQCSKLISRNVRRCISTNARSLPKKSNFGSKVLAGGIIGAAGYTFLDNEKVVPKKDAFRAIIHGSQNEFVNFLKNGVDMDLCDESGVSVMEMAIKRGDHFRFSMLVLFNKVNLFDLDSKNRTYLETAIYSNQLLMALDLIKFGLKIEDKRTLKNLLLYVCLNAIGEDEEKSELIKDLYSMSENDKVLLEQVLEIAEALNLDENSIKLLNNLKN